MTDDNLPRRKSEAASPVSAAEGAAERSSWRRRLYDVIETGRGDDPASRWFDTALIGLIVVNIAAFVLESVPSIAAAYGAELQAIEVVSVALFTLEYLVRLWTAVEVPFLRRLPPARARLHYALSPPMVIDFLAIAPSYLSLFVPVDLRILRAFRLFRLLKLARYSPALHILVRVLLNERRALAGALLLVAIALLFAATGIHYLEREANPDGFGSIPQSAWWAMATLTTVGYGDVYPTTPLGRVFGGFVMLIGLTVIALPIAIISTGFAQEMGRRDFVVTWSLVARIPILADLDASDVASVMQYLHAHNFPANWEVVSEGAPGEAMYFVASGKVAMKEPDGIVRLERGEFFGERAMIDHVPHGATVTTLSSCRLLKLHRDDYHRLCLSHPSVGERLRLAARKPYAAGPSQT
ncbi:MAG: cyclic nucleotide-gated ion channel [Hyphomicrobiaceae bacterium]|nr:cyclic nucleotide-gated ion channel [Hyphomicrobiaceae bacterium]